MQFTSDKTTQCRAKQVINIAITETTLLLNRPRIKITHVPGSSAELEIDFVDGERAASDVDGKVTILRPSSVDQEVHTDGEREASDREIPRTSISEIWPVQLTNHRPNTVEPPIKDTPNKEHISIKTNLLIPIPVHFNLRIKETSL